MASQKDPSPLGRAIQKALDKKEWTQTDLSAALNVEGSQVSRWMTGQQPRPANVRKLEQVLDVELLSTLLNERGHTKLFVSSPIKGVDEDQIRAHQERVAPIVEAAREVVDEVIWPGEHITSIGQLKGASVTTKANLKHLASSSAFLYVQLDEVVHPTGALIELGIALGRRLKTTIILQRDVRTPHMLSQGFDGVVRDLSFLPNAEIHPVKAPEDAAKSIRLTGPEFFGLPKGDWVGTEEEEGTALF